MRSYCLFREGGASFAYHVASGRFIGTTPLAHELLELRLGHGAEEANATFMGRHPAATDVLEDVAKLEEAGFFEPADPLDKDDGEFEAELDGRFSGTCNTLVLSVASGCNLACRYCYCGTCRDELPDRGLMTEATALKAVDGLFASADPDSDVRVTFFGGEPLLHKPVVKCVVARCNKLAAERGRRAGYSMTTNATLVDDETADLIVENNFGLMVSLDGPRPLHDGQCPTRAGGGSFDLAVAGIRRLMDRGAKVTVRCTMAHPAPDAMELIRFFSEFGASRVVLGSVYNPAFPSACDFTEEDDRAFRRCVGEKVIPWMVSERAAGRTPIYDPFDEIGEFQGEECHADKVPGLRCGACHGAMAVAPDGALYPCHRFVGMEKWSLGSLDGGPDKSRCKAFWRGYRAATRKTCASCWAYRICGGPCPWEAARPDGTFGIVPRLCEDTRAWIRQGVSYFNKVGSIDRNKKGVEK